MAGLVVENLAKRFYRPEDRTLSLKDYVLHGGRRPRREAWVLRDISFEVRPGEMVGIVGSNGSGKSTLLKIVAGILGPTRGRVMADGRMVALLELGAGFHPEYTGKENVFLNAGLLGMSRRRVQGLYEEIVEYSGLRDYMSMPVKHYSSGMFMRLAFAVAVNVDPDILVLDEVLSVGDAGFQTKCFERIRQIKRADKAILLVSHDLGAVQELCDRVVWLDQGVVREAGPAHDVVPSYAVTSLGAEGRTTEKQAAEGRRYGTFEIEVAKVELLDGNGEPVDALWPGQQAVLRVRYQVHEGVEAPIFGIIMYTDEENPQLTYDTNTMWRGIDTGVLAPGCDVEVEYRFCCTLPAGRHYVTVAAAHTNAREFYDWIDRGITFEVRRDRSWKGTSNIGCEIRVDTAVSLRGDRRVEVGTS